MLQLSVILFAFQPLLKEVDEFGPRIDELNEVGNAFEAAQKGFLVTSPIRRSKHKFGFIPTADQYTALTLKDFYTNLCWILVYGVGFIVPDQM